MKELARKAVGTYGQPGPIRKAFTASMNIWENCHHDSPEYKRNGWAHNFASRHSYRVGWAECICDNEIENTQEFFSDKDAAENPNEAIDKKTLDDVKNGRIAPKRWRGRSDRMPGMTDETEDEFAIRSPLQQKAFDDMKDCMPDAEKAWKDLIDAVEAYLNAKKALKD
jgi:hypothetical protein